MRVYALSLPPPFHFWPILTQRAAFLRIPHSYPITKICLLSRGRRLWFRFRNAALMALWLPALLPWGSSTPGWHWGHRGLPLGLPVARWIHVLGWVEEGCSQAWGNMAELQEFPAARQRTPRIVWHRKPLHSDELWPMGEEEQSEII